MPVIKLLSISSMLSTFGFVFNSCVVLFSNIFCFNSVSDVRDYFWWKLVFVLVMVFVSMDGKF